MNRMGEKCAREPGKGCTQHLLWKCLHVLTPKPQIFKVLRLFCCCCCFNKKQACTGQQHKVGHTLGTTPKHNSTAACKSNQASFLSDAGASLCWCRSMFLGINAASKPHFHSCQNLAVVFLTAVAATGRGGVSSQLQTATTVLRPRRNSLVQSSFLSHATASLHGPYCTAPCNVCCSGACTAGVGGRCARGVSRVTAGARLLAAAAPPQGCLRG